MKYDVFISHSSGDLEIAERVCDFLQKNGLNCWIDSRNVTGAYARSIIEGIKESELIVLVFSGKVNDSMHVENEIDNAFCMKKTIIPFRIEDAPYSDVLRYYLNKAHYVDAVKDLDSGLKELFTQVKINLPKQRNTGKYDILQNAAGEILIIKNWEGHVPVNPRMVFDGGSSALLYICPESAIMLDNLTPQAIEAIMKVDEVLVVETLDDDVEREFKVPVRKIKSLDKFL